MQQHEFLETVDLIRKENPRYGRGAYLFVREALNHTLKAREKNKPRSPSPAKGRHVSGQDFLEGIRQYALEQFGPMVLTVFDDWNVHNCLDFGNIVFQLIEYGVFGKTEEDKLEDFDGGYDFEEAFRKPFLPPKETRLRPDSSQLGISGPESASS